MFHRRKRLRKDALLESASFPASSDQRFAAKPGSAFPVTSERNHRVVARRPGSSSPHQHTFTFEQLEPRLLLSADLSPAAGLAVISGLQHLDLAVHNLSLTHDGAATAPIVNRTLAELAALGDPVAQLSSATAAYLNQATGPTIWGVVSALNQVPGRTVRPPLPLTARSIPYRSDSPKK
jgi:hypothetical protein